MSDDRLGRQLRFMAEIDKVKQIVRQTLIMDGTRFENDSEHSWHMAIMALWLSEYAAVGLGEGELLKVVKMCLIHDIVEIDAGDAYAYDPQALVGQQARERQAAERIFGLLPVDQGTELKQLWEEFEAQATPVSQYAAAMDRVQSVLNNYHSGGRSWQDHGVRVSQVLRRIDMVRVGTPRLWGYLKTVIKDAANKGWLIADSQL